MISIPAITADQMREVDRLMVEVYQIQLIQMMERATRRRAQPKTLVSAPRQR